jgi:hypothetical protein
MTWNVLDYCEEMDGYYEIDPAVMFPATIKRIQDVLANPDQPPLELVPAGWTGNVWREPVSMRFVDEAATITDWTSAAALDFAESWFKRALAVKAGKGIRVHIRKNVDYRR